MIPEGRNGQWICKFQWMSYTFISLALLDLFGRVLHLKKQLHSLDGSHRCLGDGGGHTTGDEVLGERYGIDRHFKVMERTIGM